MMIDHRLLVAPPRSLNSVANTLTSWIHLSSMCSTNSKGTQFTWHLAKTGRKTCSISISSYSPHPSWTTLRKSCKRRLEKRRNNVATTNVSPAQCGKIDPQRFYSRAHLVVGTTLVLCPIRLQICPRRRINLSCTENWCNLWYPAVLITLCQQFEMNWRGPA